MTVAQQIAEYTRAKRNHSGWWEAKCPYHNDRNPSLNFSEDGYNCFGCGATGHINQLAEDLGIREPQSNGRATGNGTVTSATAMEALTKNRSLQPAEIERLGISFNQATQTYCYRDPEWPDDTIRHKAFNGSGQKYRWEKYQKGKVDVYGLRFALAIYETKNTSQFYLVEGEPDVWTMQQARLPAVSFTSGATSVPEAGVRTLAEAGITEVSIIYDLDDAGRTGSMKAAKALEAGGIEVEVLNLPEHLPTSSDITDLYNDLHQNQSTFRETVRSLDVRKQLWEPADIPTAATEAPGTDSSAGPTLEDRSDTDNAERFIELHGDKLHYIPKWKTWMVFSPEQARWKTDHDNVLVRELAKDVGRNLKAQLKDVPNEMLKAVASFVLKTQSHHGIKAMVALAKGAEDIVLDHEELDLDPWKLGVRNGVVDLKTGEFREADPADLMMRQCHVPYDKDATAPRWLQAMKEWFPNVDTRRYVKRLAGSVLVGEQRDHIFAIHYGDGRNGKGTFIRALRYVLDKYATVIHLSLLQKTRNKQHDTVKAELFRARLAVASETEKRVPLDEASVKNLTGNDPITARRMYENPWEFDPTHSLWLQTNYLPKIEGRDVGIWSRIKVVQWQSTFLGADQDHDLDEKLRGEAQGILNWFIQGCLEWYKHGLKEPEEVIAATLAYRDSEDVIARFVKDEQLRIDPDLEIAKGELQELWNNWCKQEDVRRPIGDLNSWLEDENDLKWTQKTIQVGTEKKRPRVWEGFGVKKVAEDE